MISSSDSVSVVVFALALTTVIAYPQQQQQIDPAYLRDYYAQISQQNARGAASGSDATPIYEQEQSQPQAQPQYIQQQSRAQQPQQYVAPTARQYYSQPQQQLQYQPPTYQQQNIQYNRPQSAAKQTLAVPRRPQTQPQQFQSIQQGQQRLVKQQEEEEDYENSNPNYQFGFDVKDDEFTNYQNRKEVRDGNQIKGSYSVVDSDGFIRTVTYTADPKEGFKANVVREPTDIVVKVPTPAPAHQQQYVGQQAGQYRALPRQQQQPQQLRHPSQREQQEQQQQQYQQYE